MSNRMTVQSKSVIQTISSLLAAKENCRRSGNVEWLQKHSDFLDDIEKECLPSGSGFDNGTSLSEDSTPEKIIFLTSFHHMNENGYYDGWTEHVVTVRPEFDGLSIKISGRDRRDIKEYIHEEFDIALNAECTLL